MTRLEYDIVRAKAVHDIRRQRAAVYACAARQHLPINKDAEYRLRFEAERDMQDAVVRISQNWRQPCSAS